MSDTAITAPRRRRLSVARQAGIALVLAWAALAAFGPYLAPYRAGDVGQCRRVRAHECRPSVRHRLSRPRHAEPPALWRPLHRGRGHGGDGAGLHGRDRARHPVRGQERLDRFGARPRRRRADLHSASDVRPGRRRRLRHVAAGADPDGGDQLRAGLLPFLPRAGARHQRDGLHRGRARPRREDRLCRVGGDPAQHDRAAADRLRPALRLRRAAAEWPELPRARHPAAQRRLGRPGAREHHRHLRGGPGGAGARRRDRRADHQHHPADRRLLGPQPRRWCARWRWSKSPACMSPPRATAARRATSCATSASPSTAARFWR